jgi:tRNA(Ile)-lysidine synthase
MLSAVLATIADHELLRAGERVIVAVSGGPDSMALLHVLWELRGRLGLTLEVAAVDHGLRADAAREVQLVRERAEALGLPFSAVSVDVTAERRRRRGASLQDAARDARLRALGELARAHGADRVALGHQADDQAETVLYRIIRGTGVAGLAGIPHRRDVFVRPLLDVTRAQILRYLQRRSIPFVEDPSNADPRFARARIRHRILPALAQENPRVAEALRALAAAARNGRGAPADARTMALSRRAAATVARLASRGGTASIDVAGRRRVEVSYGRIRVQERGQERANDGAARQAAPKPAPIVIDRPGTYPWSDAGAIEVRELAVRRSKKKSSSRDEFDADRVAWPLVMRARRPGDRMRPRGGRGGRKLSHLMIDAKIARPLRDALPVVTSADDVVLFVPGLRPAEAGRPSPTTRRRVAISFANAMSTFQM